MEEKTKENAKCVGKYDDSLVDACEELKKYKAKGENVFVYYQDKKLYSTDSVDEWYNQVAGQAESEYKASLLIPEWLKRGKKIIPKALHEDYEKSLKAGIQNKNPIELMENTLEVIECLHNDDMHLLDARDIYKKSNNDIQAEKTELSMILKYSERGASFVEKFRDSFKVKVLDRGIDRARNQWAELNAKQFGE